MTYKLGRVIGCIQYFIFVLVRLTAIFLIPNTGSCFIVLQDTDREVATFLNRKFGGLIASIETVAKEDLDLVRFTFRVFRFGDSILSFIRVTSAEFLISYKTHYLSFKPTNNRWVWERFLEKWKGASSDLRR